MNDEYYKFLESNSDNYNEFIRNLISQEMQIKNLQMPDNFIQEIIRLTKTLQEKNINILTLLYQNVK